MKQRLFTFLFLAALTVSAMADGWGDEPTFTGELNTAGVSSITSGGTYLIYNVSKGKYVTAGYTNGQWLMLHDSNHIVVKMTQAEEKWTMQLSGCYTFPSWDGKSLTVTNSYIYNNDGAGGPIVDGVDDSYKWTVESAGGNDFYLKTVSGRYLSVKDFDPYNPDRVVSLEETTTADETTKWRFVAANGYDLYVAKLDLWTLGTKAVDYGLTTAAATALQTYEKSNPTIAELNDAAAVLRPLVEKRVRCTISDNDVTILKWTDAELDGGDINTVDGWSVGYTNGSSQAVFTLYNKVAGDYILSFFTGNPSNDAEITVKLNDGSSNVLSEVVTVKGVSTWDLLEPHLIKLEGLTAETTYTLTIKVEAAAANSYAGNWGNLSICKNSYTNIPGTLNLEDGIYLGSEIRNQGSNIGYVRKNNTAAFLFNNATPQDYHLLFDAARYDDGARIYVNILDVATGASQYSRMLEMTEAEYPGQVYSAHSFDVASSDLTAGAKMITFVFSSSKTEDWLVYYIANVKNIQFVQDATDVTFNENSDLSITSRTADVTINRTIAANKWSTIVLPFNMTEAQLHAAFGNDMSLKQMTAATNDAATLETATTLNANEPYLIKVTSGFTTATINNVTIVAPVDGPKKVVDPVTFQGVYASGKIPTNAFFLSNNKLYKASGDSNYIKPMRGYFTTSASAARLNLVFDDDTEIDSDSEVTAIHTVNGLQTEANDYYNLNGQRIAQPTKGVYIVNGKKVVMK